jgi:transcriptional regulator with XRE-family HTH domain/Zn-dependent peptidase ImmA (M78 family)
MLLLVSGHSQAHSMLSESLRNLRERAHLTPAQLAGLLGTTSRTIERIESGEMVQPLHSVMNDWATLFGYTLRDVLADRSIGGAPAMLFRSAFDNARHRGAVFTARKPPVDFWLMLGRMSMVLRLAHEWQPERADKLPYESILGRARKLGFSLRDEPWKQGKLLATALRQELGFGTEPIHSISRLLVETFGVAVMVAPADIMPDGLSAVCAIDGVSGVLLNPGETRWERARTSLAHELCHLLADRDALGRQDSTRAQKPLLMASLHVDSTIHALSTERTRRPSPQANYIEHFEDREQRARAFAAYLLVPEELLETAVRQHADFLSDAVQFICVNAGVSTTLARNLLGNAAPARFPISSRLDSADVTNIMETAAEKWQHDRPGREHAGVPPRWFRDLVLQRVAAEQLDLVEAHEILAVPLTRSLGMNPRTRRPFEPIFSPEEMVIRRELRETAARLEALYEQS